MDVEFNDYLKGGHDPGRLKWLADASRNLRSQAKASGLSHFKDIIHTVGDIFCLALKGKVRINCRIASLIREAIKTLSELLHEIATNYQEEHYLH